jgi:PAS domain S-box-containing protein
MQLDTRVGETGSQDDVLLRILRATAPYTGDEFLQVATQAIAGLCQVKSSFVCELLLDLDSARQVAGCVDGEKADVFDYGLPGTPCNETVVRGSAIYPESVALKFPDDVYLQVFGAEGYASVLLCASSGDPIGMMGVIDNRPFDDPDAIMALLQQLAPRVAAELERRQMENALRRSEARLRLLVEHSKDVMFYYQVGDGLFEYVSPAASEVLGIPSEALQANPDNAIALIHEDDRAALLRAMSTGSEEPITARLYRPDGELRWIEYRNFAFRNQQDQLIAIGGCIRDITPRLRAQEELKMNQQYTRTLLEVVPDTVLRLNGTGTILDFIAGEAFADQLDAEGVIGIDIKDFLPAAFVPQARRLIQTALRTGRLQRLEFEAQDGSGQRHYEARCLPFGDEDALLILRDFTAMKWHEGEEERRRLRDELDSKVEERIRSNPYGLTYREFAILHLVAEGSADKQIAESLGISIYTVNKHVGNILGKMGASSRTEAGVRAIREGLLG